MDFEIHESATKLPGVVRNLRIRIEELEKIVFADRSSDIVLPNVEIPDYLASDIPMYINTQTNERSEDIQFLDQLLEKLTDIKDQSTLLHLELQSIEQMNDHDDTISDDVVSICTENTEHLQELIDSDINHKSAPCHNCKACMKEKAKIIKKERKAKEKERRQYLKQLKINERDVLLIEQSELQNKLEQFRNQIDRISDLSEKQRSEIEKNL